MFTNREDTTDNGAYIGNEVWEGSGVFGYENLQPKEKDEQSVTKVVSIHRTRQGQPAGLLAQRSIPDLCNRYDQ